MVVAGRRGGGRWEGRGVGGWMLVTFGPYTSRPLPLISGTFIAQAVTVCP